MTLPPCRECGTTIPDGAPACPNCGAAIAAYRPLPPRPPEKPGRPAWRSALEWGVLVAVCVLAGTFFYRLSNEADQRATEKEEMVREVGHLAKVSVWEKDTSGKVPVPESAGRPAPTSHRAKRLWVVTRIAVDGPLWRREVLARHGLKDHTPPPVFGTPRYHGNASAYPEVGKYLAGRAAAIAEIEKTADAWTEKYIAELARESGLPAREIRGIIPPGVVRMAPGEVQLSEALLDLHRHLVRIDPRVHHAGGNELRFEREEDARRLGELQDTVNKAVAAVERARATKQATESAAVARVVR